MQSLKLDIKILSKKDKWELLTINRDIDPAQVTKLCVSITAYKVIRPVIMVQAPWIKKGVLFVADGQHLLFALLKLGLPIPYILVSVNNHAELVELMAKLNNVGKKWDLKQYVKAWSDIHADYVQLADLAKKYDFEYSVIAAIMAGAPVNASAGGSSIASKIRTGKFKIDSTQNYIQILNCLTDVFTVIPRTLRQHTKYVCSEYVNFLRTTPKYNHSIFMRNLEANKNEFSLVTQEDTRLSTRFKQLI